PRARRVWIVAALQQQLVPAYRNRFVDLAEDLFETENVPVRRAHRTIERAEVAPRHADIRVVDVAVDDVGHEAIGMFTEADRIGKVAKQVRGRVAIEVQRLGAVDASAREYLVC